MNRGLGLIAISLILLAPSARAAGGLTILREDVAIVADAGTKVSRPGAGRLALEARKAYVAAAGHLAVFTRTVFHTDRPAPFWMAEQVRADQRIFVVLDPKATAADRSYGTILSSMAAGRLAFSVTPPEEQPGPEKRAEIWEGMARAVLAATMGDAAPLWLREGFAAALADEGAKSEAPSTIALRKKLTEGSGEWKLIPILDATDRDAFLKLDGPAASYAMVKVLTDGNGFFLRTLIIQSRRLLLRVAVPPDPAVLRKEFTALMRTELEAGGAHPRTLVKALVHWIDAGFPTGRKIRRCRASRIVRAFSDRKRFGVTLTGRFGKTGFVGGEAAYVLPWKTEALAWVGLQDTPGTNLAFRPEKQAKGAYREVGKWKAPPRGNQTLRAARLEVKGEGPKRGFVIVGVTSPNGIRYSWLEEVEFE